MRRPMQSFELRLGEPLPWSVYDAKGTLLLSAGQIVGSEMQRKMLLTQGAVIEAPAAGDDPQAGGVLKGDTPLALVLSARQRLRYLLAHPPPTGFPDEVMDIVSMLVQSCRRNPDVALATIPMRAEGKYSVRHAVDVAIACQVAGTALKLDAETLTVTLAAALTMNIAMTALQDHLQSQHEPLRDEQRELVRTHSERGVAMLAAHGVEDALWLESVRDHHEHIDGSGYPAGRKGDEISLSARLIRLSDVYCARVSGRDNRAAMSPAMAMRWLFLGEGDRFDRELASMFIKTLGIYPPGTGVRLKSGSLAVVTQRGATSHQPHVASVTTSDGLRLDRPIRRDYDSEASCVAEVVDLAELGFEPGMALLWGNDAKA